MERTVFFAVLFATGTTLTLLLIFKAMALWGDRVPRQVLGTGGYRKGYNETPILAYRIPVLNALIALLQRKERLVSRVLGAQGANDSRSRVRELPFLIDLFVVCTDGGLNLLQAIERLSNRVHPSLQGLLEMILREVKLGKPLVDAVEGVARSMDFEELRLFSRGLRLGQALGTPINEILRQTAQLIRERANQAMLKRLSLTPLKLTVCALLFFYPPIFVVLVLPHLLAFINGSW